MHNASLVTVLSTLEQLVKGAAHRVGIHGGSLLVQVLLQVLVEVLKDQEEAVLRQTVNDIQQLHDVVVLLEFLQHSNLSDRCARNPIVAVVNLDLFDGDDVSSSQVFSLIDDSVGALAEFRNVFEGLLELSWRLYGLIFSFAAGPTVSDRDRNWVDWLLLLQILDHLDLLNLVARENFVLVVFVAHGGLGKLGKTLTLNHRRQLAVVRDRKLTLGK